jgi:hypothetical protein
MKVPVLESRVLRTLGPKRDEVTGVRRNSHNAVLHDLNSSSNNIKMIESKRIRYAGHVVRMGKPLGRPKYRYLGGLYNRSWRNRTSLNGTDLYGSG